MFLVLVFSSAAFAERRVALLLGTNSYQHLRSLDNAINDALAMKSALDELGFETFLETDRDLRRTRRALEDFVFDAADADVALVFFAGHGVEIAGENRLLPVDADASSLDRLKATTLPLDEVREAIAAVAPIGMVVLDACRDDPFGLAETGAGGRGAGPMVPPMLAASVSPGLGRMGRSENVLFAFAAAPGETASDGDSGNSPFTAALTKYLPTDGLEIRSVLTLVQQDVYDSSDGSQLPYVESGLPATFFAAQTGELPERERLLLAMADVTPDLRDEIERVAAEHDMPLAPLYGALIENRLGDSSVEDRRAKLAESAAAFRSTREKLRTFASSDTEVTRLRDEAEQALSLGSFLQATSLLDQAVEIDRKAGEAVETVFVERTVSQADTLAAKAGVARAELRHQAAIAALEDAAALHARIEELDVPDAARKARIWLLSDIGELHVLTGDTARALGAYERMHDAAERELLFYSGEVPSAERDLSASHNKIGEVLVARGNLEAALLAYEASHTIFERLAARNAANAGLQRDLSVSYNRMGDMRRAQGDLAGALQAYEAGLVIRKRLVGHDAGNTQWQSDLSLSHNKFGDVHLARGDLTGALQAYEASLVIRKRLVGRDAGNTQWQSDLSVSHNKIGDVHLVRGDLLDALETYEAGLVIRKRLVGRDAGNMQWLRDLSVSHERIGEVLRKQGDLAGALQAYEAGRAIHQSLVARDRDNKEWQHDLSVSHGRIGDMRRKQGDLAGAVQAYEAGHAISKHLARLDPSNVGWQRSLIISNVKLANVGNDPRSHYASALEIAEALVAKGALAPGDTWMLEDLRGRLAAVEEE